MNQREAPSLSGSSELQAGHETSAAIEAAITIARLLETVDELEDRVNELEAQLQESSIDSLTGIFNKTGYEQFVRPKIERSSRNDTNWFVIFYDLKGLRQVNNDNGHAAGDQRLKTFAAAIVDCSKAEDYLVRWGGDEFLLFGTYKPHEVDLKELEKDINNRIEEKGFAFHAGISALDSVGDLDDALDVADPKGKKTTRAFVCR